MGCCLGNPLEQDKEIVNARSINEIISILESRKKRLNKEQEMFERYLEDPNGNELPNELAGNTIERIKKRVTFLTSLYDAYNEMSGLLKRKVKKLNISDTIPYVIKITQLYYQAYDINNELSDFLTEFVNFCGK